MSEGVMLLLFFVAVGVVCSFVGYVGNKIADKGGDAVENALKHKKNVAYEEKTEALADRFRH